MTDFGQVFRSAGNRGASVGQGHSIPGSVAWGAMLHGLLLPEECPTRRGMSGCDFRSVTLWLWMLRARPDLNEPSDKHRGHSGGPGIVDDCRN